MNYEAVIGLEIHAELATESKLFCSCSAHAFGAEPNTHVCPACYGMPGALPRLNRRAVELGMKAGMLLGCEINRLSSFDKKNYFYPDLPTGYQLTQWFSPIASNGFLDIGELGHTSNGSQEGISCTASNGFLDIGGLGYTSNGSHEGISCTASDSFMDIGVETGKDAVNLRKNAGKRIGIKQIHLEEDAGKLIHEGEYTLVDMNRSGVPLIEIVTRPELSSAEEVEAFLDRLRTLLRFARISGAVMAKGELRCDVNLSVRPAGSDISGVRVELKNMNSVDAIKKAVKYEIDRHIRALRGEGETLIEESRGWDEAAQVSFSMRAKESAADYRYFPDPSVPPIYIDEAWLERVRGELPELPEVRKHRYMAEYGLSEYDASQITSALSLCLCFEGAVKVSKNPKDTVNWLLSEVMSELNSRGIPKESLPLSGEALGKLILLTAGGKVSRAGARRILPVLFDAPETEPLEYAERNGLIITTDTDTLYKVATDAVNADPKSVSDYLGGREKALMALFGKCMKALGGNCDPQELKRVLVEVIRR